ncbi:MAG: sensor domain-containing diguanylate cyclase [Myxococcota bacterium]|nr:sensor domain-containing diguanylate cyclase [Myxococcota bacterium]
MNAGDLLTAMKRTVDQLAAFNTIAKALTSTLEVHEVLRLVMQKVSELLQPRNWSLLLEDPQSGKLYFELAVGAGAEKLKELRLEPGEGIVGSVFKTAVPRRVDDVRDDPAFANRFDDISAFNTRSVLAVPLVSRGKPMGVIELVNGPGDPVFTQDDLHALLGIAEFAAIAIENARNFQRVQELTLTDEHTGLYNARHLHALLEAEVIRARRFGHPLSLVFLDLDRFKQVNDTYGHLVGSALLKEVGELLAEGIRQVDSAFRFGGDEFALLLIETDAEGAQQTALRLRDALGEHRFLTSRGLEVRLTASLGVASFPAHARNASELLQAADDAMYQVKGSGRNNAKIAAWVAGTPPRGVSAAADPKP